MKKESYVRGIFLSPQRLFRKSKRWGCATMSSELVFKFHDNPIVNVSRIIVLTGQM